MRRQERSDQEGAVLQPRLPTKVRGVKHVDSRRVIDGIFWRLRTGSRWRDVPERNGPRPTLCNRFMR